MNLNRCNGQIYRKMMHCISGSASPEEAVCKVAEAVNNTYGNLSLFLWLVEDGQIVPAFPKAGQRDFEMLTDKAEAFLHDTEKEADENDGKGIYQCGYKLYGNLSNVIGILYVEFSKAFAIYMLNGKPYRACASEVRDMIGTALAVLQPSLKVQYFKDRANELSLVTFEAYLRGRTDGIRSAVLIRPCDIDVLLRRYGSARVSRLIRKWADRAGSFCEGDDIVYGENFGFAVFSKTDTYEFSAKVSELTDILKRCCIKDVINHATVTVSAEPKAALKVIEQGCGDFRKELNGSLCFMNMAYYRTEGRKRTLIFADDYLERGTTAEEQTETEPAAEYNENDTASVREANNEGTVSRDGDGAEGVVPANEETSEGYFDIEDYFFQRDEDTP